MASSLTSTLTPPCSKSPFCPNPIPKFTFQPSISSARSLRCVPAKPRPNGHQKRTHSGSSAIKAVAMDFSGSFFERRFNDDDDEDDDDEEGSPLLPVIDPYEGREEPECPPGLRQYESMVVLRPNMSEDERLTLTQKYEELLVAGGGMYVEVFNRGVIPLAYEIRTRDRQIGNTSIYLDGIYLLFSFFTKPESIEELVDTLKRDDDIIRSSTFKVMKKKKWE